MNGLRTTGLFEGELPPTDDGHLAGSLAEVDRHGRVRKVRILKEQGDRATDPTAAARNRAVIREIRRSYNQLTGVGDPLVRAGLAPLLSRRDCVGSLDLDDMRVLNHELAELASSIFGPTVARRVYDHINHVIGQTFP